MELTLKRLLEQAEFTKVRGRYDVGEVDDFIDRAAAMAAKVEVQLTQALERAKGAPAQPQAPAVDVEAEVERRVAERLAAMPAPAAPSGPTEDETAEEVRRTLVLAQRTADAAVKEAREEADQLLADAKQRSGDLVEGAEKKAAELVSEAEASAATTRADSEAQAARDRREARQRLAGEISELEGVRESLRSDVTVLERHVAEQRDQLGATISELQRLLEDPAGFRLAPVPALNDPEIPDLGVDPEPEPEPEPASAADDPNEASTPVEADDPPSVASEVEDRGDDAGAADAVPDGAQTRSAAPQALTFDEMVDHADPGIEASVEAQVEGGPPTAPVPAVEIDAAAGGAVAGDDDAFLAELRKAMSDDEPLGPRDPMESRSDPFLDDDDQRRGWRFGRRG